MPPPSTTTGGSFTSMGTSEPRIITSAVAADATAMAVRQTSVESLTPYTRYMSAAIIILGAFYCLVYLSQFLYWQRYRRKKRARRMEHNRLRLVWRWVTQDSRSDSAPTSFTASQTSLMNVSTTDTATLAGSVCQSAKHKPRLLNYNGKHRRRRLIWQWSVAMGYCRYDHAHRLNALIEVLEQQKEEEDQANDMEEKQRPS